MVIPCLTAHDRDGSTAGLPLLRRIARSVLSKRKPVGDANLAANKSFERPQIFKDHRTLLKTSRGPANMVSVNHRARTRHRKLLVR